MGTKMTKTFKTIRTHSSFIVDIGMIYLSGKGEFWWFEWVVGWEIDVHLEGTFVVGLLVLKVHHTSYYQMG